MRALLVLVALLGGRAWGETLAEQGMKAYEAKDYERSAALFVQAAEAGDRDPDTLYAAASLSARLGRKELGLRYLREAFEAGFSDLDGMESDPDLGSLRAEPRYRALVAEYTALFGRTRSVVDGPALKTPYREDLPENEKIAGLSRLWAEVRFGFVNFDLVPELDWDAAYLAALAQVRKTRSTLEYYEVLRALVAQLRDGHTNVSPPPELIDRLYGRPALTPRRVQGKVLVVAAQDPALVGLEIVKIDGVPVEEHARRIAPLQSASTPQDLEVRTYEYWLLGGAVGEKVRLEVKDAKGKTRQVEVPRIGREERRKLLPRIDYKVTRLPGNVVHIAVNTFENDGPAKAFAADLPSFAGAAGLILDLRDNGGGNSGVGWDIFSRLVDRPFQTSRWRTRRYVPPMRAWGAGEPVALRPARAMAPAEGPRFLGKVVLLVGPRTFSAAEDFSVVFDAAKRGAILGEATGGSTGQPISFALPGGGSARVCAKRDTYPDGKEFVGKGVQPTRVVRATVADVRAGRDPVLEAARKELLR